MTPVFLCRHCCVIVFHANFNIFLCTELKQLLKFSTGGEERPPSGVVFVEVSPDNESIYASTCLCEVIFPQNMASLEYKHFKGALSAVVQDDSFNCI